MNEIRIGQGVDVHPFSSEPRPLVLGGVTIPDSPGLAGHSDADVLAHAVADALLGALALGDLGTMFGVDEPELAGATSVKLLGAVADRMFALGWRTGNIDATLIAQRPRLAPHAPDMRRSLAKALHIDPSNVSVKATTTDQLGTIGRAEGIACMAVCTVVR